MTLRTTPLVLGLVAVTFAATGCGQNEPAGGNGETSSPSQRATASASTLREVTLNVTGMS